MNLIYERIILIGDSRPCIISEYISVVAHYNFEILKANCL